jgi:hypothetical protein
MSGNTNYRSEERAMLTPQPEPMSKLGDGAQKEKYV